LVIPQARALGFAAVLLLTGLHHALISAELSDNALLAFILVTAIYCAGSWIALRRWYVSVRGIDLGTVFLFADLVLFTVAVYATGAEKSWLLLIFVLRAADQAANGFRPVLAFAHWSTACYGGLVLWIRFFDGREVLWPVELVKILGIYFGNLYVSMSAMIYEKVRRQMRNARDLIVQLQQRTRELEQEREKSAAEAQARDEFLRNAARELRTPIQAMLGAAHLSIDGGASAEQREQLEAIRSSAQLAATLVNDILVNNTIPNVSAKDMSAPDAGGLVMAPFPVAAVVRSAVVSSPVPVQCVIAPDVPPVVIGDRIRVGYALRRVLDHAREVSREKRLLLDVHSIPAGPGGVTLEFCASALSARLSPANAAQDYALATAGKIAGVMGGEIRVDEWNGQGIRIHMTIPFGVSDNLEAAEAELMGPLRILVAEDNQVNQRVISRLLEKKGHHVQIASNGREAVDAAQSGFFDVILMDILMPDMDGLEAARLIREASRGRNSQVPIIAVSAVAGEDERLSRAGLDAWLPKPFLPEDLYRLLERVA
jgi:CheY-like chemotaxis protein